MGKLLQQYKKYIYDGIVGDISSGDETLYAFASRLQPIATPAPQVSGDDKTRYADTKAELLFGKKIQALDIAPMVRYVLWKSGTVFARYDDRDQFLHTSNFYVTTPPSIPGGSYLVFKCIDNGDGSPTTEIPDQVQDTIFEKIDGYQWKYMYSITDSDFTRFATTDFIPVTPNTSIQASALTTSGLSVFPIVSGGNGYITYHSGTIQSVPSATLVQISPTASDQNGFYTVSSIYLYSNTVSTGQLIKISAYVSNTSGNWVSLATPANTSLLVAGSTLYNISPTVNIQGDGVSQASAYSVVDPTANTIQSVVVVNPGYGYTRATATIQANTSYGSGASLYPIVPPAKGHGADPASELDMVGYCVRVQFNTSESNTIPIEVSYNTIGLLRNPYHVNATSLAKTSSFTTSTFNQLLKANTSPPTAFTLGETVVGQTSGAQGRVAFSNTSVLYLTGDKFFANNELITGSTSGNHTVLLINSIGDLYDRDLDILYLNNIQTATRSNTSSESFKLIVQI